ncbi:MAG: ATP-binding cassette domain-containing protein [Anaerolineae bacterium]|nr:ATP-binding cassette domain-containing protein [Chloroflexota bacterium]
MTALRGVDLQIPRGTYLALVGQNGSGKSTLARCLSGLLVPTAGEVIVNGRSSLDPGAILDLRAMVGMVFQDPENQFVTSSVEDEVAFGAENLGVPPGEIRERVVRSLAMVGLAGAEARDPHMLSAGDKVRLAIAATLSMEPDCILLDEATALLDPISRRDLLALVMRLHQQGRTTIVVTHHMDEVVEADQVAVMDRGRIVWQATPSELFASPEGVQALGLSLPMSAGVAQGLRRRGLALAEPVVTDDDLVREVSQWRCTV